MTIDGANSRLSKDKIIFFTKKILVKLNYVYIHGANIIEKNIHINAIYINLEIR